MTAAQPAARRGRAAESGARVIVGVDGSPASSKVLAVALDEAATHRRPLVVVAVHVSPASAPAWGMPSMRPRREELAETEQAVHTLVDRAVAEQAEYAKVNTTVRVLAGVPTEVLLSEAKRSDHLIIGSRGVGGWRRALLGSVSSDVVHSATCQTTVVPTRT